MGNVFAIIRDVLFIILEAAILYYVYKEWKQGKEHIKLTKDFQQYQMEKYRRYKGKKIIKQILEDDLNERK